MCIHKRDLSVLTPVYRSRVMACVNLSMDVMEDHSARRGHREDEGPLIKHYRVSELIPAPELPLHQLLKREPAVWAVRSLTAPLTLTYECIQKINRNTLFLLILQFLSMS